MSEAKFTKGPWNQSHRKTKSGGYSTQVYDSDGETICTLAWYPVPTEKGFTTNRSENANLIACAPDMYEMLAGVKTLIGWGHSASEAMEEMQKMTSEIDGLLKRARGE